MQVAVFRAAADGRRTARKLAALGHTAVLAPVIEIVPTGQPVPADADVLVFTSAHVLEVLDGDALPTRLRNIPCYCVGSRTATAAGAFGFSDVRNGDADATALAALLVKTVDPSWRLVLVAGRDRKPTIEDTLRAHGFDIRAAELYEARQVEGWPSDVMKALLQSCNAALHFSRRSAGLAIHLAESKRFGEEMRRWRHYCLSHDIAACLTQHGLSHVETASHPDEQSLLTLL